MKIKFIKADNPKYQKELLYKIALRDAVSRLVLTSDYKSYSSAYGIIMKEAKAEYIRKYK